MNIRRSPHDDNYRGGAGVRPSNLHSSANGNIIELTIDGNRMYVPFLDTGLAAAPTFRIASEDGRGKGLVEGDIRSGLGHAIDGSSASNTLGG
jgi:hypothetical protein